MHKVKGKKACLCFFMATLLLAAAGCGGKAEGEKEVQTGGALAPTMQGEAGKGLDVSADKEADAGKEDAEFIPQGTVAVSTSKRAETVGTAKESVSEEMPQMPQMLLEVSDFFEFLDAAIAPELKEERDFQHFTFFRSVVVDGMEFAVLDCRFMEESAFHHEYLPAAEQLATYYPELEKDTKLFLKRAEGAENWEATVLKYVSENGGYSDPFLAFNSAENGMIVFGEEYMFLYITKDGGATWTPLENIPSPGGSVVGSVRCLTGGGEGRFLMGHRYKGVPEAGQVSLTEDNGQIWTAIELPQPPTGELRYRYSEPLRFYEEDGKLFLEMYAYAEDLNGKPEESLAAWWKAYYTLVSEDGGVTWEFAQPEEALEFLVEE